MVAEGLAGVALVGHDPTRHAQQAVSRGGLREFVGLPRRDPEGYGPTDPSATTTALVP